MTPPINDKQKRLLNKLYYVEKMMFGRDKIFKYLQENYPDYEISRRQVANWLNDQEINQLYHPVKKTRKIKPTILSGSSKVMAVDLINMEHYGIQNKYLLTATDLFSKYAWAKPLKNKEGYTVAIGIQEILDDMKRKFKTTPSVIRSDNGAEFKSKNVKDLLDQKGIKQVFSSSYNPESNGGVERLNYTIKKQIKMIKAQNDNNNWSGYLDKILENYNKTWHRVIKTTPLKAMNKRNDKEVDEEIKKNIEDFAIKKNENVFEQKFHIGDQVRLKIERRENRKIEENFTKQLFTVYRVFKPPNDYSTYAYNVKDEEGKEYTDKLYDNDLLLVTKIDKKVKEPIRYLVSKILEKRKRYNIIEYLVKFTNFKDPEWVRSTDLKKDVPKMVDQFERKQSKK